MAIDNPRNLQGFPGTQNGEKRDGSGTFAVRGDESIRHTTRTQETEHVVNQKTGQITDFKTVNRNS